MFTIEATSNAKKQLERLETTYKELKLSIKKKTNATHNFCKLKESLLF